MNVRKEDLTGSVMEDMADGMMDGHNPQMLINKLAEGEQMEAALYEQIAQAVPSEELRQIILHKARHERRMAERLSKLSHHFGLMPGTPAGPPMPYTAGKGEEKK
ncbi:MAG: ferritin-like domain-containing protein [Pelotomaculum sp.]|uniref:Uncharacterized protein n=1 Tax=Pelotomaculum thermopropionicum (strain DSM 13744 / JCM 10971 / SI) TaxID=370438 RepID=A5D4Y8_PELTS|nr:ferritin-like domain-containing protein [Pelotomaculum sp.]BAF58704.1 hypothetical protein PTH_0523 [Pelotomaculum thermopropionicum SI]